MLEAMQHSSSVFITLTYEDPKLPLASKSGLPSLRPRDLQLFLKRLRRTMAPIELRFFAVGEYGNETERPHYHAALFNFPQCERGETVKTYTGRCVAEQCCPTCAMVRERWGEGDIEVRTLGQEKCGYLAGYVTKKMTGVDDVRLRGRHPEFSRQSRRPGVGFLAVAQMARMVEQYCKPSELVDVPNHLLVAAGKQQPLGRYLRNKMRLALGLSEGAPDEVLRQAWEEQVLPMWKIAKENGVSLSQAFAQANEGYEASLRFKANRFKGKI